MKSLIVIGALFASMTSAYAGTCKIKVKPIWVCHGTSTDYSPACGFALSSVEKVKMESSLEECVEKARELKGKYEGMQGTYGMRALFKFEEGDLKLSGKII